MYRATVRPHPISTFPSHSKLSEVIQSKSRKQNFSESVNELYIYIFYSILFLFLFLFFFFQMMEEFKGTGLLSVKVLKLR